MQYPLDAAGRSFKKQNQKLNSLKRARKSLKRDIKLALKNIEAKTKELAKARTKKDAKFANPEFTAEHARLNEDMASKLDRATNVRIKKEIKKAHVKKKERLLRKYDLMPVVHHEQKAERQLATLKRHHEAMKRDLQNMDREIARKQISCDALYAQTSTMPLSRYDLMECQRKARTAHTAEKVAKKPLK